MVGADENLRQTATVLETALEVFRTDGTEGAMRSRGAQAARIPAAVCAPFCDSFA